MIKRLKVKDFRSIAELDLSLDPVTVLVGRSGTGKSNVVQSLRFLRNLLLNPVDAINQEGGWPRITPVGKSDPVTSIDVIFSVPGEDAVYEYSIDFGSPPQQQIFQSGQQLQLIGEGLFLGDDTLFQRQRNAKGWQWIGLPNTAVLPGHLDTPMLGSFPSLQKIVFAHAALSTGIGYYHLPSTTLADTPANQTRSSVTGLWDNAANFRDIMRAIIQDFHHPAVRKGILASLQAVNPSIASIELDSLTNPQRAIVGHKVSGRILELGLDQESDGLRRFYAHLLALYQSPSKLTLVFEEPENAIFPGALSLLADEFKAAPRENRGQIILTTHSPGLLDQFDVNDIRVVDMQDGKTIVGPVAKDQRDAIHDHLLTTGELLTVETPKLEPVNGTRPTS